MLLFLAGDLDTIVALFKPIGSQLAAVGFTLAGVAVVKKVVTNHEQAKNAIITYLVALIAYLLIWSLV